MATTTNSGPLLVTTKYKIWIGNTMKTTEFLKENSIIAQEADDMHKDHEVQMARSQMYSAAQSAIEIHRLLKDISELEGIEGWVASKLTLASEYLESVRDYLKYEAASAESEMMEFAYESAEYAVDRLIAEGPEDYHRQKEMFRRHDDETSEHGAVSTAPGWAQGKAKKERKDKQEKENKKLREMATGGASSSSGMAISMTGPAHKPTSGVPKKLGNAHKPKKVTVGKGVY